MKISTPDLTVATMTSRKMLSKMLFLSYPTTGWFYDLPTCPTGPKKRLVTSFRRCACFKLYNRAELLLWWAPPTYKFHKTSQYFPVVCIFKKVKRNTRFKIEDTIEVKIMRSKEKSSRQWNSPHRDKCSLSFSTSRKLHHYRIHSIFDKTRGSRIF